MRARPGRIGYTTGACAAAAALGCSAMIARGMVVDTATITLPGGERVTFPLQGQRLGDGSVSCFVVKDGGGDPDVTDGAEIHVTLTLHPGDGIVFRAGKGVGTVTKPGLPLPVGEPAINPVPRRMIGEAVRDGGIDPALHLVEVTVSVPDGEQRAKRTVNERLGIRGGLSILGTTGIVIPVSAQAWIDTVAASLDVARAAGCDRVVLSSGRSSEMAAENLLGGEIPPEGFILMGDHVAASLRLCRDKGFDRVVVAAQFAKMVKIALGHPQTHVRSSLLDLREVARWFDADPATAYLAALARNASTARHLLEESGADRRLAEEVCRRALSWGRRHGGGIVETVLLSGYDGRLLCRLDGRRDSGEETR